MCSRCSVVACVCCRACSRLSALQVLLAFCLALTQGAPNLLSPPQIQHPHSLTSHRYLFAASTPWQTQHSSFSTQPCNLATFCGPQLLLPQHPTPAPHTANLAQHAAHNHPPVVFSMPCGPQVHCPPDVNLVAAVWCQPGSSSSSQQYTGQSLPWHHRRP